MPFCRALAAATGLLLASLAFAAAQPLNVGATFMTNGLDPAKGSNGWALTSHGVGENLFSVDPEGRLVPELAEGAQRIDELTWRIHLKSGRFFADGTPLIANRIATALSHTIEVNKIALATGGKLRFAAESDLDLRVTTEWPVPVIAALLAEWPLVVYHLRDDGTASFSGPYEVTEFKPDQSIVLRPNPFYAGSRARSDVVWRRFGDGQTLALAFEAGSLDLAFGLPVEAVSRLKSEPGLAVKSFAVGYQYFAILNTRRGALADRRVRRALDRAFDRAELVAAIGAGAPATGAYAPYFPFAAKNRRPMDLAAAQKLLDDAGWTRDASGQRAWDRQPLKLSVVAYPQRPDLVTMLPVVKSQLGKLGIGVETRIAENITGVAASGDFDILLWAQHTAPSGDPAFFLNSSLRSGATLNYSGYASASFDALLDRLAATEDPAKRSELALEAQQRLFDDVPLSFLVVPEWFVGVSKRLRDYQPWGSDYHVLRADIGEAN